MSYAPTNYRTPWPVMYPDGPYHPTAMVPGWGVRPEMAGPPRLSVGALQCLRGLGGGVGLGYDLVIKTPFGNQTISIPVEQMITDVAHQAVDAAWPPLRDRLYEELPTLLAKAEDAAVSAAVNKLWPAMKPKLRGELDRVVVDAKSEATKLTAIVGTAIVGTIVLGVLYLKKGQRG